MRIIVTAGPTREYIDPVRFITNASSGRMGYEVAAAAAAAGHEVTLLSSPLPLQTPPSCRHVEFISVHDLHVALQERFDNCDALVMAAAVRDFRPEKTLPTKLHRRGGPIMLRLFPTEDVSADLGRRKRADQVFISFAVEDGSDSEIEAKARRKMSDKNADYVVANTPKAMAAASSRACILSSSGIVLPWAERTKQELAGEIVKLLSAVPAR